MKSIWAFVMTAATVTVYVHVRHKEPIVTPVHYRVQAMAETPRPAPAASGGIVVAPFDGGAVDSRWGSGERPKP